MGDAAIWATMLLLDAAGCSPHEAAPPIRRDVVSVASFRQEIAPVFEKHCTSSGCHGEDPDTSITLDLRAASAYGQLVGVPAEMGERHLLRVTPGDPEASMVVHKLSGNLRHKEGKRMPLDPDTGKPLVPNPWPPMFLQTKLVPWILAGAPDN